MTKPLNSTIDILGVRVGTQPVNKLISFIADSIDHGDRAIIAYVNIHTINLSRKYPWFRKYLNQASKTYCDGYGVKLGAFLLGYYIPERYTAPDWLPALISTCAANHYTLFFLGARPGVAEKAARELTRNHPGLQKISTHHGYFDTTPNSPDTMNVIQMINSVGADILVLGLGTPSQEKWLTENWEHLNCRVAMPVGAALDYIAKAAWRAPHWMTDHGFEWLGRLIAHPRRFWKRYLFGIPSFYYNVLRQRLGFYPRS